MKKILALVLLNRVLTISTSNEFAIILTCHNNVEFNSKVYSYIYL